MSTTPEPDWFDTHKPYDDNQIMDPIIKPDPNLTEEQRDAREAAYMETYYAFWADYFGPTPNNDHSTPQQRDSGPEAGSRSHHLRPVPDDTTAAYSHSGISKELDFVRTAPVGRRNPQLNTSAFNIGQLVGAGVLDAATAAEQLLEAATQRTNPLPAREATRTIQSGLTAGQKQPRNLTHVGHQHPPVTTLDDDQDDGAAADTDDPDPVTAPVTAEEYAALRPVLDESGGQHPWMCEVYDDHTFHQLQPAPPLIEGILSLNGLTWLYGPPGTMKTFTALAWAAAVGTGLPWNGYTVHQQGWVLYVAAEAAATLPERIDAWREHHHRFDTNILLLNVDPALAAPRDRALFFEALQRLTDTFGAPPVMVVFDTQSRIATGLEENSSTDMNALIRILDRVKTATGACVLIVHHSNRSGNSLRGSNAMDASAESIIRTTREGEWLDLVREKVRNDRNETPPIRLRPQPVAESMVLVTTDSEPSLPEQLLYKLDAWGTLGASPGTMCRAVYGDTKNTTYMARLLNQMAESGDVARIGKTFYPKWVTAQRLADESQAGQIRRSDTTGTDDLS